MSYPKIHALGCCFIAVLYPILGLVYRDAVVEYILGGVLLLGVYRYLFGLGVLLRREAPWDAFTVLFRSCRGRLTVQAVCLALVAVLLFAVCALLPVRIFLDFSMPLAKISFFIPAVYCIITALWPLIRRKKQR